jgi:hypothetical protein
MTTMFARLLLADLFVHGIGGAKYDELGDAIAQQFFGFAPPEFLTLSMTVWLGLRDHPATAQDLARYELRLRELRFNPERHLKGAARAAAQSWIEAKQEAIGAPVETRRQRVDRWRRIDRCNQELSRLVAPQMHAVAQQVKDARAAIAENRLAHARDYTFVLHHGAHLAEIYRQALAPIGDWRRP